MCVSWLEKYTIKGRGNRDETMSAIDNDKMSKGMILKLDSKSDQVIRGIYLYFLFFELIIRKRAEFFCFSRLQVFGDISSALYHPSYKIFFGIRE